MTTTNCTCGNKPWDPLNPFSHLTDCPKSPDYKPPAIAHVPPRPDWITSDLMARIYDKHGAPFREWIELARSGRTGHYGAGMPTGWEPYGLHRDQHGEIGLWLDDGVSGVSIMSNYVFVLVRFLVGVDLGGLR